MHQKSLNHVHFRRIRTAMQQPLRPKSKILATSPYTGEALGAAAPMHKMKFFDSLKNAMAKAMAFLIYFARMSR